MRAGAMVVCTGSSGMWNWRGEAACWDMDLLHPNFLFFKQISGLCVLGRTRQRAPLSRHQHAGTICFWETFNCTDSASSRLFCFPSLVPIQLEGHVTRPGVRNKEMGFFMKFKKRVLQCIPMEQTRACRNPTRCGRSVNYNMAVC